MSLASIKNSTLISAHPNPDGTALNSKTMPEDSVVSEENEGVSQVTTFHLATGAATSEPDVELEAQSDKRKDYATHSGNESDDDGYDYGAQKKVKTWADYETSPNGGLGRIQSNADENDIASFSLMPAFSITKKTQDSQSLLSDKVSMLPSCWGTLRGGAGSMSDLTGGNKQDDTRSWVTVVNGPEPGHADYKHPRGKTDKILVAQLNVHHTTGRDWLEVLTFTRACPFKADRKKLNCTGCSTDGDDLNTCGKKWNNRLEAIYKAAGRFDAGKTNLQPLLELSYKE